MVGAAECTATLCAETNLDHEPEDICTRIFKV